MEDRQQFERRLMREWLDRPQPAERMFEGVVSVPEFVDSAAAEDFISGLAAEDTADVDVIDPVTGEIMLDAGQPAGESYYHPADEARRDAESERRRREIYISGVEDEDIVNDFESKYSVTKGEAIDQLEGSVEELNAMGYDVEQSVPQSISRKDGFELSDNDVENIDEYIDLYRMTMSGGNIELFVQIAKDEKTIHVTPGLN